ncbi:hypothetical protein [Nonomuraea sp. NPDC005650]|uniref:hypothetical protein n=1 Tax=Nonomuraea sp. NPDC005650 TaxID=3157045 RepID=UPI0033A6A287
MQRLVPKHGGRIITIALTLLGALLLTPLSTGPAMAAAPSTPGTTSPQPPETRGINGMIAEICILPGHPDITDFEVEGYNQDGNYAKTPIVDISGDTTRTRCVVVGGYWWKGTINVLFYNYNGTFFKYLGTRSCGVGYIGADPAQCRFP